MGSNGRAPRNFSCIKKQETRPEKFRNRFHEYSFWASLSADVYRDNSCYYNLKKSEILNTKSGFAARVYDTGKEIVLAIRGTDKIISNDGEADSSIATKQFPIEQVVDMYKYINSERVQRLFENARQKSKKIIVIGHSLGGYLAQVAIKSYPNVFDRYYTYNAPSVVGSKYPKIEYNQKNGTYVDPLRHNPSNIGSEPMGIPDEEQNMLRHLWHFQNASLNDTQKQKSADIMASDGLSLIANLGNKSRLAVPVKVSGESHSIEQLQKILKFYDLAISKGAKEEDITNMLSGLYKLRKIPVANLVDRIVFDMAKKAGATNISDSNVAFNKLMNDENITFRTKFVEVEGEWHGNYARKEKIPMLEVKETNSRQKFSQMQQNRSSQVHSEEPNISSGLSM